MKAFDFDLVTIGAGSGGVAASRRAGSYGARVAIVEESRFGGTCVVRGCVPKKLLVYGSHFADELADARGFGWTIERAEHDWPSLVAAKNREVDRLSEIYRRMLRDAGVTLFEGRARLIDRHTVQVGDRKMTAKYILVATGGRPVVPEIRGASLGITSDDALDLPRRPDRIVIVGGGYIGVEFAGIFNALGTKVTLVVRGDGVLRGFDQDVRSFLTQEMTKRGVVISTDCNVVDIERAGDTLSVMTRFGDSLAADVVLFATGRAPHTSGIGLEEAGVKLDKEGAVTVDASSKTSVDSIYAIGDCTNRLNLTPVAIAEGRAFAETMFHDNPMQVEHLLVPSAVFSQPPVATVGCSEEHARSVYGEIDVYATSFRPLKHSLTERDERTMVKLVVDRSTDRVVGAHMVGADAAEIMQGIAIAVRIGATKRDFDRTIGIHPTAAEELVTLRDKRPDPVHVSE